jgi:hypothetical protein
MENNQENKKEVKLSDFKPFHDQLDEIRYFDKILDLILKPKTENEDENDN